MATVQTAIINRALRMLSVIASGASPTTNESNDALVALNAMVDAWKLEKLLVYAFQEESLTLTSGAASKTIGPSGNLISARPVAIEQAWVVDSAGVSRVIDPMTEDEYASIALKTQAADYPIRRLYRGSVPDATVVFWPVPNQTLTCKLLTRVQISTFALADTLAVPPGYEQALASNLAVIAAPEFETEPPPWVAKLASDTKRLIKGNNQKAIPAVSELDNMTQRSTYNVLTDRS